MKIDTDSIHNQSLEDFPDEILLNIFSFFKTKREVINAGKVSKRFHAISKDNHLPINHSCDYENLIRTEAFPVPRLMLNSKIISNRYILVGDGLCDINLIDLEEKSIKTISEAYKTVRPNPNIFKFMRHTYNSNAICVSSDVVVYALNNNDHYLYELNIITGIFTRLFKPEFKLITKIVKVSEDRLVVYSYSNKLPSLSSLEIWNVNSRTCEKSASLPNNIYDILKWDENTLLLVRNGAMISEWDICSNSEVNAFQFKPGNPIHAIKRLTKDLICVGFDKEIIIYDVTNKQLSETVNFITNSNETIYDIVSVNRDGILIQTRQNKLYELNLSTGIASHIKSIDIEGNNMAVFPDGKILTVNTKGASPSFDIHYFASKSMEKVIRPSSLVEPAEKLPDDERVLNKLR